MVMCYAFYAYGFRFESHLAGFRFVFFFRLSFCFFSFDFFVLFFFFTFFRLTFYVYGLV